MLQMMMRPSPVVPWSLQLSVLTHPSTKCYAHTSHYHHHTSTLETSGGRHHITAQ